MVEQGESLKAGFLLPEMGEFEALCRQTMTMAQHTSSLSTLYGKLNGVIHKYNSSRNRQASSVCGEKNKSHVPGKKKKREMETGLIVKGQLAGCASPDLSASVTSLATSTPGEKRETETGKPARWNRVWILRSEARRCLAELIPGTA
ncbi:unnamed protein product [Ranitomeya imitator]|uniref:Uncharacterized protein n=1 Tax=Ranitomeya imitator TaxID=111125 RepID=A0ABN9MHZ0_9NEOB|nr:unnamed protein product [Ranitomeya imitator]